ncbi:MAG: hypothetical protein IKT00_13780 [Prevotella sp.]|nr:hypothetical protein [Prevotella sp.]
MKRIFSIFIMAMALAMSAHAGDVFFQYLEIEYKSGVFPDQRNGHYYYQQDVWWMHDDGGTTNLSNPYGNGYNAQDNEFIWTVEITGTGITIPSEYYETKNGNHYELKTGDGFGSNIYFDATQSASGTLTITATNPDYQGLPYTCSYTIIYHVSTPSIKWDFNSSHYTITGNWDGTPHHMNEHEGSSSPTYYKYNDDLNNAPGENMITEAQGLLFSATNGKFGGNDPNGTTPVADRFVCLGEGASVTIPASILQNYANPRVRIKMDRYGGGNDCALTINNAKDALGKTINSTYKIGGSTWWGDKKDFNYRGEYHFIIDNKSNPFSISVDYNNGQWLMLLSIEVYDGDDIKTENSVLGSAYQLLNHEGGTAASTTLYLHYRGRAEKTKVDAGSISTTGTVVCNSTNLTNMGGNAEDHTYTSTVGQFGTFRFRIDCYEHSGTYCTDYAWRTNSVGYMQKRSYPYTWDFTDVKTYASEGMTQEAAYSASGSNVLSNDVAYNPVARCLWKANNGNYELQLAADAAHNVHYCGGSQLWYGDLIIPELQYLAFTPVNFDAAYNAALTITNDGLKFDQELRNWWGWRITIPDVPSDGVVYVRAHKERTDDFCNVGYYYGPNITNKSNREPFSTEAVGSTAEAKEYAVTGDNSGDVIYVVPAPDSQKDVTLFFTGVTVRKIAVSTDQKHVSDSGWATESRDHVIDPELTGYMTGYPFENLVVTSVDYGAKTIGYELVAADKVMKKCDGDEATKHNAYIIHNTNNEQVDILQTDGGFHLFIPDMHDYVKANENNGSNLKTTLDMSSSKLTAQLAAGTVARDENGYRNYVLTNESYRLNDDGSIISGTYKKGEEAFYQVPKGGIHSNGNQAYLPVSISAGGNAPMFTFMFDETTAIDETVSAIGKENNKTDTYFNLNGQKLKGMPTQRGIYIVNGKKVVKK